MTDDFIQDAIDSLERDPEVAFLVLAAHYDKPGCHRAAHLPKRKHLEWVEGEFERLKAELEAQYDAQEAEEGT